MENQIRINEDNSDNDTDGSLFDEESESDSDEDASNNDIGELFE